MFLRFLRFWNRERIFAILHRFYRFFKFHDFFSKFGKQAKTIIIQVSGYQLGLCPLGFDLNKASLRLAI